MRCPNCGMTSFRSAKKCTNCNTDLKTVSQGQETNIFTIYHAPIMAGVLEEPAGAVAENSRFIKTLEYPDTLEVTAPTSDFNLDLSDAATFVEEKPAPPLITVADMIENAVEIPTSPLTSGTFGEEEIEVEGLGFEPEELLTPSHLDIEEKGDLNTLDLELEASVTEETALEEPVSLSLDLDAEPSEETEVPLDIEEPAPLSLDLDAEPLEETKLSLDIEEPAPLSLDLDAEPSEETKASLDVEESGIASPISETTPEHPVEPTEDPRLSIPDLELGMEPEPPVEPIADPRLSIPDLELTLEIEEPPQEKAEIPEASLDGIKLEIEVDPEPDKDSPSPENPAHSLEKNQKLNRYKDQN